MRWTEGSLLDVLIAGVGASQPAHLLRQVVVGDRRIDGILVLGGRRVGIEVKTSRADFKREHDAKRDPTWRACHGCVYLSPPNVIQEADLPPEWGLWHVLDETTIVAVRAPTWHVPDTFATDALATELTRRTAATDDRLRHPGTAEEAAALTLEVERLQGLLAGRESAVARERARAQDAAEQVVAAAGEDAVCSECKEPILYTRVHGWRHLMIDAEEPCEALRAETERRRREAATGAAYVSAPAPRVKPHLPS